MGFELFQVLFAIAFIAVLSIIVVVAVRGVAQWSKNNKSPRLSVHAVVVAKAARTSRSGHTNASGHHHTHISTTYTITFEVPSGDRMFFNVSDYDYNMIAEGDRGLLHFQGTRFLGFDRQR